jgi:hypothetical protein
MNWKFYDLPFGEIPMIPKNGPINTTTTTTSSTAAAAAANNNNNKQDRSVCIATKYPDFDIFEEQGIINFPKASRPCNPPSCLMDSVTLLHARNAAGY